MSIAATMSPGLFPDPRPIPAPVVVDLDGVGQIELQRCRWIERAPCGCACGVVSPIRSGKTLLTEDAVWATYERSRRQVRADREAGFRWQLVTAEQSRAMNMECRHDPKWGIPQPIPAPAGFVWARSVRASNTAMCHLIPEPDTTVILSNSELRRRGHVKARCNRAGHYVWTVIASVPSPSQCAVCARGAGDVADGESTTPKGKGHDE